MRFRIVIPIFILALMWGITAGFGASKQAAGKASSNAVPPTQAEPSVVMPVLKHEFEPVVDGAEVLQDFTVQNIGDGPLAIHQVKTG